MTRIFVAGHKGMVGSAIVRQLEQNTFNNIVTMDRSSLDLSNQQNVSNFFADQKIDQIYLAAAKVGGIHANNTYPAEFIYENLIMEANIIHAAYKNSIKKLLFLGSSCIYPKLAEQPMREDCLLTGELEPSNEPYAIAKIAGIKLCESYNRQYRQDLGYANKSIWSDDNFHSENSHVIPALLYRFHEAKISNTPSVKVWGTGKPLREFLHVDDLAEAVLFCLKDYSGYEHINVGSGVEVSIRELVEVIAKVVGYNAKIVWDKAKPDGTPRKLMDVSRLERLGWKAKISLEHGLTMTYKWFLKNFKDVRK